MCLPSGDHAGLLENSSGPKCVSAVLVPPGSVSSQRSLSKSGPYTKRPAGPGLAPPGSLRAGANGDIAVEIGGAAVETGDGAVAARVTRGGVAVGEAASARRYPMVSHRSRGLNRSAKPTIDV